MLESTDSKSRWKSHSVTVPVFVLVIGKLNEHFSIKFHLFPFVDRPSVPLLSGWGFREQRPAFRLPHWGLWLGRVSLSLEALPGPLLSFPLSQTKWVKSTHLEGGGGGGGGGQGCWGELWDRPVVVSGRRAVCQTVTGCERANEPLTECVCMEKRGCRSIQ